MTGSSPRWQIGRNAHGTQHGTARADLLASLFVVGMVLLIMYALLTQLSEQAVPPPADEPCVQFSLSDRGLPPCDGHRPGSAVVGT